MEEEGGYVLSQGMFANKKVMTHSPRMKWDIFTLVRAFRVSIMQRNAPDMTKFAAEIALAGGGMLLLREVILMAGEYSSPKYLTYVPSLVGVLNEWSKRVIANSGGIFEHTFDVTRIPRTRQRELLDVARQLLAIEKDFVCDSLARRAAYDSTGSLEHADLTVVPPVVNRDPNFCNWPGVPTAVANALTAMIHGIHTRDERQAVRCAMYACLWSYPDDVWKAIVTYGTKMRMKEGFMGMINDLNELYALYVHITVDRQLVPMHRYWCRARVFIVRAILLYTRPVSQIEPLPKIEPLAEDNIARLFNPHQTVLTSEVLEDYMPHTGRFEEDVVRCAPADRVPSYVAQRYLYCYPNLPQLDSSNLRQELLKQVATMYSICQTSFGVLACMKRFEPAFRCGLTAINASSSVFRIPQDVIKEYQVNPVRAPSILDPIPFIVQTSLICLGSVANPNIFSTKDSIPEYIAMFNPGSLLDNVKDPNTMWALVRGPYAKPGLYIRLLRAQSIRQSLGLSRAWTFSIFKFRGQEFIGYQVPWRANAIKPTPISITDLFVNAELRADVDPRSFLSFLILRYLIKVPATGAILYLHERMLYPCEENVAFSANAGEYPLIPAGTHANVLANYILHNTKEIRKLVCNSKPLPTLSQDVIAAFPAVDERLNFLQTAKDTSLFAHLCAFLIDLPPASKKRKLEE